jgi:AraC family transcriptional regulator
MNFARLLEINPGRGINRSDNPRIYEKNIFYKEYQELNNQQNMATFIETHGILLQLVSRFLTPDIFKHNEIGHIPVKILNAISYIQLNLHQELIGNQPGRKSEPAYRLFFTPVSTVYRRKAIKIYP